MPTIKAEQTVFVSPPGFRRIINIRRVFERHEFPPVLRRPARPVQRIHPALPRFTAIGTVRMYRANDQAHVLVPQRLYIALMTLITDLHFREIAQGIPPRQIVRVDRFLLCKPAQSVGNAVHVRFLELSERHPVIGSTQPYFLRRAPCDRFCRRAFLLRSRHKIPALHAPIGRFLRDIQDRCKHRRGNTHPRRKLAVRANKELRERTARVLRKSGRTYLRDGFCDKATDFCRNHGKGSTRKHSLLDRRFYIRLRVHKHARLFV